MPKITKLCLNLSNMASFFRIRCTKIPVWLCAAVLHLLDLFTEVHCRLAKDTVVTNNLFNTELD